MNTHKPKYEDWTDWIFQTHQCCSCHRLLRAANSIHVNIVQLGLLASWKYPVMGNVLKGTSGIATAIVCDECLEAQKPIKFAIEYQNDGKEAYPEKIVYHPIEQLTIIDIENN